MEGREEGEEEEEEEGVGEEPENQNVFMVCDARVLERRQCQLHPPRVASPETPWKENLPIMTLFSEGNQGARFTTFNSQNF